MVVSNRVLGTLAITVVALAVWSVLGFDSRLGRPGRSARANFAASMALRDSIVHLGWLVRTPAVQNRVDSALGSYPAGTAPSVLLLGDGAPAAVAKAESLFTSLIGTSPSATPMRLALIQVREDSIFPTRTGGLSSFALFTELGGEETCTTVRVISPADSTQNRYDDFTWRQAPWWGAVGPCWFYSRFGPPGPQMRAWLDARLWDVAASVPPNYRPLFSLPDVVEPPRWLYRLLLELRGSLYGESMALEACVFDRPQVCEAAFLGAPNEEGLLPRGVVGNDRVRFRGRQDYLDLPNMAVQGLLAMMLEQLGPARFAEFWSSDRPVAESFQAAAGMSLGEWYQSQLRRQIREAGFPEPHQTPVWPSAIGFLALTLGGTLWFGGRRQVR